MRGRWAGEFGEPRDHPARRARRARVLWAAFPRVLVGALPFHSPNDVSDELDQLHGEMMQLGQEILEQLFRQEPEFRGWDIPRPEATADMLAWRRAVWVPFWDEWTKFRDAHADNFWQNLPLSGSWDRIQDFRARLAQIRDGARRARFQLRGPAPTLPRRDLDLTSDLRDLLRISAYAALGVAGVLVAAAAIGRARGR